MHPFCRNTLQECCSTKEKALKKSLRPRFLARPELSSRFLQRTMYKNCSRQPRSVSWYFLRKSMVFFVSRKARIGYSRECFKSCSWPSQVRHELKPKLFFKTVPNWPISVLRKCSQNSLRGNFQPQSPRLVRNFATRKPYIQPMWNYRTCSAPSLVADFGPLGRYCPRWIEGTLECL